MDSIWDGEGKNPNAWLTVMRHDTNVSVVQGRQGGTPQSFWLIDYSGFERMYYDTVAGFAYWQGDLGKLENPAVLQFPAPGIRGQLPAAPAPGGPGARAPHLDPGGRLLRARPGPIRRGETSRPRCRPRLRTRWPGPVAAIAQHLGPAIAGPPDRLNPDAKPPVAPKEPVASFADWERGIASLTVIPGQAFTRYLPSVMVLRLTRGSESRVYSLVANRVYKSQFTLVFADASPLYDRFSLSVYPTIVNGFPNLFADLTMDQAGGFLEGLRGMDSQSDWDAFKSRYGILRNSARLWPFYDWINDWNFRERGAAAGFLDLTYYDTPD